MIRKPIADGKLYEPTFDKLNKQIEKCFKQGPNSTPSNTRRRFILGAIVPASGYELSGKCSAWAYDEIGESHFPNYYILITSNNDKEHYINLDNWETPFGIIKNANIDLNLKKSPMNQEHEIEIQLPFLQFVNKDKIKDIKIIPISTNKYDPELCQKIANLPGSKIIICPSNLTAYGPEHNYVPFVYNKKESIEKQDNDTINLIKNFQINEFLEYTRNKSIKGRIAIANTMKICQLMHSKNIRLLNSYKSADLTNDYTNSLTYASILFE